MGKLRWPFREDLIQILLQSLQELERCVCTSYRARGFPNFYRGGWHLSLPFGMDGQTYSDYWV